MALILGINWTLILSAMAAYGAVGTGLAALILAVRAKLVSTKPCVLKINDMDPVTITGGETLLNSLLSCSIPVPSPCGGKATCKQCKVQVLEGAGEVLDVDKASFTRSQLQEGWRLACQCKVKDDMQVGVEEHLLGVKEFKAKVISNKNVATFIKELIVEIDEDIDYRAGGYLQFHVPPYKTNTTEWKETMEEKYFEDWERFSLFDQEIDFSSLPPGLIRAYSMASFPAEGKKIMFNIRIASPPFEGNQLKPSIPWGICSSYTFSLKPGDEVTLSGPYGESYMINDERELVFLIGGAGSSFGRSHIKHLFETEQTKRKVTLWYGARSLKENIYQEEYEELDSKWDNFSYRLVLSNPTKEDLEGGWPEQDEEKTAFLFKAFEKGQLSKMQDPEDALYYVCGPPMHNQSVIKLLDDYGVPPENIILDDFGS